MSGKIQQLEAVIAGYREELAVQRLQYEKRDAEWAEEKAIYVAQNLELGREIERLDNEAERQEEKILDLEGQMIQPMMATGTTHNHNYAEIATPEALDFEHILGTLREPELSLPSQIAICTVAQMLEHRAEHMAIRVGGDAGEYADIVRTVHILRQDIPSDDELEREAEELFEALTTAF